MKVIECIWEFYWSSNVLGRQRGKWPRTWQPSLPSPHLLFFSSIALSHFLYLSIVEKRKKKNIFSIFSVSSSSAKHFFCALARTQTQHISYQVKAGSEEATAPDSIQSDWAPMSTDKVMTFLSWWHTLCNSDMCMHAVINFCKGSR